MGENQNQFISLYEGHCYRQAGPTTTPCVEMALRMLDSDTPPPVYLLDEFLEMEQQVQDLYMFVILVGVAKYLCRDPPAGDTGLCSFPLPVLA